MKLLVCYTLFVVATSALAVPPTVTGADATEIQEIIDSIYHPSTDPATAAALEEMLLEALGIDKAVIEDSETVDVEPAIIDESTVSEPGQEQISPIDAEPAIIDESIVSEPANYGPEIPAPEVVIVEQPDIPEEAVLDNIDIPEKVIIAEVPIPV